MLIDLLRSVPLQPLPETADSPQLTLRIRLFSLSHPLFSCYDPRNMLTRALTCPKKLCMHLRSCSYADDKVVVLRDARSAGNALSWVGITDLYDECASLRQSPHAPRFSIPTRSPTDHPTALCLFDYRLLGVFPDRCRNGAAHARADEEHVAEGRTRKHDPTNMPDDLAREVDALTAMDASLYRTMLLKTLCELTVAEHLSGVVVLSESAVERLVTTVSYLKGVGVGDAEEKERDQREAEAHGFGTDAALQRVPRANGTEAVLPSACKPRVKGEGEHHQHLPDEKEKEKNRRTVLAVSDDETHELLRSAACSKENLKIDRYFEVDSRTSQPISVHEHLHRVKKRKEKRL